MIHFAIVGCGKMGQLHAQELERTPGVQVVALVDPVTSRTAEFREKYFPKAKEFAGIEAMLADRGVKVDAVCLVTPHSLHYPHAKMALEHGVHVLVEKPMVTNSNAAYDLWRTVKSTGKLLAIAYQSPYTDEFAYLAQMRERGEWGKVQTISGWLSQNWRKGTSGTWRQDPEISGGGQMYDSGAHLFNAVMWLMNDPVVEAGCFYDRCGTPVDINGVAIAKFSNGALGSFCVGGNCPPFRTDIQIQTDRMMICVDQYGKKLEIFGADGKPVETHVKSQSGGTGTPHLNLVNAILGKEKLRAGGRFGVLLSALMDAMYQSADARQMVRVEPVPGEI
jgi:predicted dehydrogenase